MERLRSEQRRGLNTDALRNWGTLFLVLGVLGRSLLQNRILGLVGVSSQQMLEIMSSVPDGMTIATAALVLQLLESCAAPFFCFLLVEGFIHTANYMQYLVRVLGLALITELPYNFAMSGKFIDLSSRNPVFSMVLCLILLYFYKQYSKKSIGHVAIKLCVTIAALVWGGMLGIESGVCCVIITAAIWAFRNRPNFRVIMGCTATIVCTLFSLYYLAAPMSFLAIHYYNGEKGARSRAVNYLTYPAILLAVGIAGLFI